MHVLLKVMDNNASGLMVHVIIDSANMHQNHIQHISNAKNMVLIVRPMEKDASIFRSVLNTNTHLLVLMEVMVFAH